MRSMLEARFAFDFACCSRSRAPKRSNRPRTSKFKEQPGANEGLNTAYDIVGFGRHRYLVVQEGDRSVTRKQPGFNFADPSSNFEIFDLAEANESLNRPMPKTEELQAGDTITCEVVYLNTGPWLKCVQVNDTVVFSLDDISHYLKDSKYKNSTVHPSPDNFVFLMEGKIKVTEFIWE